MTLLLPLPDKRLSPNARGHWSGLARAKRSARDIARLVTLSALRGEKPPPLTRYKLAFFFATKRRRDDDNWSAACKAYRDGVADALRIDDHYLSQCAAPVMEIDALHPRLEFTLLT